MGTIESLQLKAEEKIDEDVNNEESAGTDEQSDNGKAERQDDSKVVQNPPENKAKRVYKKRKINSEPLLSNPDVVGKDDKSSEEQKAKSGLGVADSIES
ncbi:hypothetical protein FRX31_011067 [Thalictrum thalictroides]|uniref:Uncharacterized protein n=1 Tax=Thalictrum thalictroides TaxID=46969 RepID=A0A7J6WPP8_THATH|nr:hypothetical protein FRX31_011067 [Thalictrum thalictroides]